MGSGTNGNGREKEMDASLDGQKHRVFIHLNQRRERKKWVQASMAKSIEYLYRSTRGCLDRQDTIITIQ
jgi:hypothetical protein